LKVRPSNIL